MRIDLYLVEKGLVVSRNRARELIASGRVVLVSRGRRQPVGKPSVKVDPAHGDSVEIAPDHEADRFVSRGGFKMQGALERTGLDVSMYSVLDVGISTGGFTDCLLQMGAASAIGLDVGHGQLAKRLRDDPRVRLLEGINARHPSAVDLISLNFGRKFDLIVIDVSFVSLALVLPEVVGYLREDDSARPARILALVKPQFEVGRAGLGKNGIVKDPALHVEVEQKIRRSCVALGLVVEDYFESSIEGSDGNREFFVYAGRAQTRFAR